MLTGFMKLGPYVRPVSSQMLTAFTCAIVNTMTASVIPGAVYFPLASPPENCIGRYSPLRVIFLTLIHEAAIICTCGVSGFTSHRLLKQPLGSFYRISLNIRNFPVLAVKMFQVVNARKFASYVVKKTQ